MTRYQDIYPSSPALNSADLVKRPSALALMTAEYFEAEPGSMPYRVFDQHHILINLKDEPHRVENWRDGEHRDFIYRKHEIIVTPAGIQSGWSWHQKSRCIVITLEPKQLEHFAQNELGVLLTATQLKSLAQFKDDDISLAALQLIEALKNPGVGSEILFESLARVFLVKLIQKYGCLDEEKPNFRNGFSSTQYKRVLDLVRLQFGSSITLEQMAQKAGLSPSHFSRIFKETVGKSPMQYLTSFRIEESKKLLADPNLPIIDVAMRCGFADQSHFSRTFKQVEGITPKQHRERR